MTVQLTRAQVNAWRLSKHHLDKRASKKDLVKTVSDLCGVQAQVLTYAALALWARVDGITREDVLDALWSHRSIVKTWCMRGTLHLIASSDLPTYVAARKTTFSYKRDWLTPEITEQERERITDEIRESLDGRTLTREQLGEEVAKHLRMSASARKHMLSGWGNLLQPAAVHGYLCFGPSQGSKVTFVRPDQWIGKWKEPEGSTAWKILLRQFFSTYGPADHHDIGHWWGLRPDEAKTIMQHVGNELEEVDFSHQQRWVLKDDIDQIFETEPGHSVRLLPSWDCYVMFYHPREEFISQENRLKVFRKLEGNAPVLLIDGLAGGTWELARKKNLTEVRVRPFSRLSRAQKRAVGEEAESMAAFYDTESAVIIL